MNLVIPRRAFEIFTDKFCYINKFTQLSVSTLAHTGTLLLKIETLHPPSGKVMRNAAFSAIRAASKHIKMLQRLPNCFFFFRETLGNLGVLGFQQAVILPDLWTELGLTCDIQAGNFKTGGFQNVLPDLVAGASACAEVKSSSSRFRSLSIWSSGIFLHKKTTVSTWFVCGNISTG